jgi:hypothetical protein
MTKPQITTHYADGTPSETRDMTDEEMAQLTAAPLFPDTITNETPSPS